jgi:hypothetical protein
LAALGSFTDLVLLALRRPSDHSFVSRDSWAAQKTQREMKRKERKRWESIVVYGMDIDSEYKK